MQSSQPAQQPNSRAQAASAPSSLSPDFERQLKTLRKGSETSALQAGRVSIIGLDRVKEHLGSAWNRLAERADRIAQKSIARHLLPGDIFTVFQKSNYVIVFATLDPEHARMKCLLIADEVMKALLGEDGAELISVETASTQLDDRLGPDGANFMAQLFANSPALNAPAPKGDIPGADQGEPVAAADGWTRRDGPAELQFHFRPVWDTARNVLSTYVCIASPPSRDPNAHREGELEIGDDPEEIARLDYAACDHVLRELARLSRQGFRVLVGLTVHFETLAAAAQRRRYVQTLAQGLTRDGAKLLVVEIAGVPDGVPHSRVLELTTPLKPHCRALLARFRIETAEFTALRGTGVVGVGCNAPGHPATELAIMQHMNRFARAAERAGLATYVRGLRTLSLAAAAVGAGFSYIDGEGVAKLVDRPEHVVVFNLADVYRLGLKP